jgi:hypothetical protein
MPSSTTNKDTKSEKVKDFYKGLLKRKGDQNREGTGTSAKATAPTSADSPTKIDSE